MTHHRRSKMRLTAALAAGLFLALPGLAHAQAIEGDEGVIYKKKTVMSFEDDTIDGDLTKPDHGYIESRKKVRHSNLIKIRDNFRQKILNSFVHI